MLESLGDAMNGNHDPDALAHELHDANGALDTLGRHVPNKPGRLDGVVARANDAVDGADNAAHSDSASAVEEVVKFTVDNVQVHCVALLKVLDGVAKVHPFVAVAALAFKTIINLEMTRRENDKRVLALHAEMCNMMSIVVMLRHFPEGYAVDGETVEARLSARMHKIAEDIKACAASCDHFQNKPLIVRVLTSLQWESTLSDFAKIFETHKEELHKDLVMLSAFELKKANATLSSVHSTVDTMAIEFQALRSPDDRRLLEFIGKHGGAQAVWQDEGLRQELDMLSERIGADREDRLISRVANLWDEVGDDLQLTMKMLFRENQDAFERKFQLQWTRLQENLSVSLHSVSLERSNSGSFEIIDPDLQEFWIDMGWREKRRVKANKMITGLLQFSTERTRTPSSAKSPGPQLGWSSLLLQAEREDAWAVNYLNVNWPGMQSLLEAIDADGSSYVTIPELNIFSAHRPAEWSLPRWLAYWTVGTQLALKSYYERIHRSLDTLRSLSSDVLPLNRAYVQKLLGEGVFYACDCLLSGIHDAVHSTAADQSIFEKFRGHENAEEEALKDALKAVNFELDAPNTLGLVIGNRRLEKSILPLLYLLVEQCADLLKESASQELQKRQVFALRQSFWTLLRSSYRRVDVMKEMLDSDDDDTVGEYLEKFSYGLYCFVYFYDKLGDSEYVRSVNQSDYFTPGSRYTSRSADAVTARASLPASPGIGHEMWSYKNVQKVVTSPDHPMHAFVQLCVEQGVMAPDGDSKDAFMRMAREAVLRASRRDELTFEEIFQTKPRGGRRQDSLRPVRAMSLTEIETLKMTKSEEELQFYSSVVDNIVRRQIIHSPVMCNKCKKRTINMTRLLCLGCQEDDGSLKDGKTTDYCAKCLFEDLELDCASAIFRKKQHAFLQLRQFTFNKWGYGPTVDRARTVAHHEALSYERLVKDAHRQEAVDLAVTGMKGMSSLGPCCHICQYEVELPFWFCLECNDVAYICQKCNLLQEKRINVLVLEDVLDEADLTLNGADVAAPREPEKHHWSHNLVLVVSTADRPLPGQKKQVSIISPAPTYSSELLDSPQMVSRGLPEYYLSEADESSRDVGEGRDRFDTPAPSLRAPGPPPPTLQTLSPWMIPLPLSPAPSRRSNSLGPSDDSNYPSAQSSSPMSLPPGFMPTHFTPTPTPKPFSSGGSFQPMVIPGTASWTTSVPSTDREHGIRRQDSLPSSIHSTSSERQDGRAVSQGPWDSPLASQESLVRPLARHRTEWSSPPSPIVPTRRHDVPVPIVPDLLPTPPSIPRPPPTPFIPPAPSRTPSPPLGARPPPPSPPRGDTWSSTPGANTMPPPPVSSQLFVATPPWGMPPMASQPSTFMPPGGGMATPWSVPPSSLPQLSHLPPFTSPPFISHAAQTATMSSELAREFLALNDRLHAMESSIVTRVSRSVSSRLQNQVDELEDIGADLHVNVTKFKTLVKNARNSMPDRMTPSPDGYAPNGHAKGEERPTSSTLSPLVEELKARVSMLEGNFAALNAVNETISPANGDIPHVEVEEVPTTSSLHTIPEAPEESVGTEDSKIEEIAAVPLPAPSTGSGPTASEESVTPKRRFKLWKRAKAQLK